MTHKKDEPRETYLQRVTENLLTVKLKLTDRVIGYIMPLDGGEPIPTKRFSISYATGKNKSAHMVPAREV